MMSAISFKILQWVWKGSRRKDETRLTVEWVVVEAGDGNMVIRYVFCFCIFLKFSI
jgi:hypothetical protein